MEKRIRIYLTVITIITSILFFLNKTFAQDIHFSQFQSSPLTLNPANTGDFDGNWRVMNTFRSQWKVISVPYETNAAGYDRQFNIYSEKVSAGLVYIYDRSGSLGFTANKIYISAAYSKKIDFHKLNFGLQGGFVHKGFNPKGATFPSQFSWETGGYDSSLDNNESSLSDKVSYFDLNVGIKWRKKYNKITPNAGIAFYHLNFPNESFNDNLVNRLTPRSVIHGGSVFDLNNGMFIEPNFIYMIHKKAFNFMPGVNFGIKPIKSEQKISSIYTGVYYRGGIQQTDAIIATIGINYLRLNLGLSYDVNISELDVITNKRGAFEISLIYTGLTTVSKKVLVPCDIY